MLVGWNAERAAKASLEWGTACAKDKRSLLARVPSVIVPEEINVLVNPAHSDATQARAVKVRRWLYDRRLGH